MANKEAGSHILVPETTGSPQPCGPHPNSGCCWGLQTSWWRARSALPRSLHSTGETDMDKDPMLCRQAAQSRGTTPGLGGETDRLLMGPGQRKWGRQGRQRQWQPPRQAGTRLCRPLWRGKAWPSGSFQASMLHTLQMLGPGRPRLHGVRPPRAGSVGGPEAKGAHKGSLLTVCREPRQGGGVQGGPGMQFCHQ